MLQQFIKKISSFFNSDNCYIYFMYTGVIAFVYSPVVLQDYAFTDDYSILVNAILNNMNIFEWDTMNGRPIFGLFQYITQHFPDKIESFAWFRAISVISTILLSIFLHQFLLLKVEIKEKLFILFLPLFISLIPAIIVYNSWATCSIFIISLLLSGFAYHCTFDKDQHTSLKRIVGGMLLLICSFFIYQPTGMAFLYFIFLCNCLDQRKIKFISLVISALMLGTTMIISYLSVTTIPKFLFGKFFARTGFTNDVIGKVFWFFREPFTNSINNYNIDPGYIYTFLSCILFFLGFFFISFSKQGIYKVLLAFLLIFGVTFPNLITQESWASFRSCIGIELIVISIIIYGIVLGITFFKKHKVSQVFLSVLLLVTSIYTQNTVYNLFIKNAQNSYQALSQEITSKVSQNYNGSIRFDLSNRPSIGLSKVSRYDEFGNDSLGVEWCLQGMALSIKRLKDLHYKIDGRMILNSDEQCHDNCTIINIGNIIRHSSVY